MKTITPQPAGWNILYTKPNEEKKVASALKSRKIEFYLPVKKVQGNWWNFYRMTDVPVFQSMIFIKTTPDQAQQVKRIKGVVNFLYWLDRPAVVNEGEISMLQNFLYTHSNVTLEKRNIGMFSVQNNTGGIENIEYQLEQLELPSIGYRLIGEGKEQGKLITMASATAAITPLSKAS
jgi:hypothetical protein